MPVWNLVASIFLPNVGGWMGTIFMVGQVRRPDGQAWYQLLKKPTWTPPDRVFAPIWTALYTGMGYASYLVYEDCHGFNEFSLVPLSLYGGQLLLNWTSIPIFFGLHNLRLAYYTLLAVDAAALACTISFVHVNRTAAYLMLPYLGWLGFATALNRSIMNLNKDDEEKKPLV